MEPAFQGGQLQTWEDQSVFQSNSLKQKTNSKPNPSDLESGLSKFQAKCSCRNLTSNCKLVPPSLPHFHHWVAAGQIGYNNFFRVCVAFFLWTHLLPYPLLKTYTWWSYFSMGSLFPPLFLFLKSLTSGKANHWLVGDHQIYSLESKGRHYLVGSEGWCLKISCTKSTSSERK